MNIKNRKYMEGEEFKTRQGELGFFCRKSFEFVKKFAAECRSGWYELFHRKPKVTAKQLSFMFLFSKDECVGMKMAA